MPEIGQQSVLRSRPFLGSAGFRTCDLPESAPAIGSQTFMRLPCQGGGGQSDLPAHPRDVQSGSGIALQTPATEAPGAAGHLLNHTPTILCSLDMPGSQPTNKTLICNWTPSRTPA